MCAEQPAYCRHSPCMSPVPWTAHCYCNCFYKGIEVAWLLNWFVCQVISGAQAQEAGWLYVGHWAVGRSGSICILCTWIFVWPIARKGTVHIHITSCWKYNNVVRRKNWVSTPNTKPQEFSQDTCSQFHKLSQEMQRTCSCSRSSIVADMAILQSQFPKYRLFAHIFVRRIFFFFGLDSLPMHNAWVRAGPSLEFYSVQHAQPYTGDLNKRKISKAEKSESKSHFCHLLPVKP